MPCCSELSRRCMQLSSVEDLNQCMYLSDQGMARLADDDQFPARVGVSRHLAARIPFCFPPRCVYVTFTSMHLLDVVADVCRCLVFFMDMSVFS